MGNIYKPNQIKSLINDIKKAQEKALLLTGQQAFEVMQKWILEEVYIKVPESENYHRTNKLLESLTLSKVFKTGNMMSIKIYVPNEAFNDYAHKMWYDVPSLGLNEKEDPTASQVMQILENSLNPYREGTNVMDNVLQELKYAKKVFLDLQKYMKAQGFKII